MIEKTYETRCGTIHYWTAATFDPDRVSIVFLPGLTADHRLFEKQTDHFELTYNVFVWDAPGHNLSRPFELNFTLMDKAQWLDEILTKEGFEKPLIVGQSMGGYVGQAYIQKFPGKAAGFISIDSAPLKKEYMKQWEINLMKKMEPVYRMYPWKTLLKQGPKGTAETEYGQNLMKEMMLTYEDDPKYYAKLAGHGYRMLAEAVEADLPYDIDCPALLICGYKDKAGSTKKYNCEWTKRSGITLAWVMDGGHNSNTDNPYIVNLQIEEFIRSDMQ